jgi:predicted aspartyl protease
MSQAAQINALQTQDQDSPEIIHEYDEDSDNPEESAGNPTLQISMHALRGKKAKKYTFTLQITIGKEKALALVDTGSTTTLITSELAAKANCCFTPTPREKVQVANGETLWTEFLCNNTAYDIQGIPFNSNFRVLKLKGV